MSAAQIRSPRVQDQIVGKGEERLRRRTQRVARCDSRELDLFVLIPFARLSAFPRPSSYILHQQALCTKEHGPAAATESRDRKVGFSHESLSVRSGLQAAFSHNTSAAHCSFSLARLVSDLKIIRVSRRAAPLDPKTRRRIAQHGHFVTRRSEAPRRTSCLCVSPQVRLARRVTRPGAGRALARLSSTLPPDLVAPESSDLTSSGYAEPGKHALLAV